MTIEEPTLTDAKGLGGIIAQAGFDYQVWDALIRLPNWLKNPAFDGMIFEGLEDLEVRFFAPHAPHGHFLDRFQAKSGMLTRAELIDVFNSFEVFAAKHPSVARVQTLVTPALPPKLAWLARDPDRVRQARPFYSPFADIQAASNEKLRQDLVEEFGNELGSLFANSIEVSLRNLPDRTHAEMGFAASMEKAFPHLGFTSRKIVEGFGALVDLIAQSRGVMLTQSRLVTVLEEALGSALIHNRKLKIHIRSDRNGSSEDAIAIDASRFSGSEGQFPPCEEWQNDLVAPLTRTADWAKVNHYQHIALSGSYRLTTAFALGWSFRSATGFEIDIPTRQDAWATDDRPTVDDASLPWKLIEPGSLVNGCLKVGVGVMRDPTSDILATIRLQSATDILTVFLPAPLATGTQAQASVRFVKGAVVQAVARLRPIAIDLYFVGPAAFAIALGHRWNALPPTQLHEFINTNGCYVPTLMIDGLSRR
ncbi:SAVED domain-containing protein [Leptolyngbya sp. PL-A3]|uniref:SAVED domain-containing protein n=1 Tax=Leptolyngbya sp. PL-A3 TaxID=2933911 RepID=UPI0032973D8A